MAKPAFHDGSAAPQAATFRDAAGLERLVRLNAETAAAIGRFDHVTHLPNRLQFIEDFEHLRLGGDTLLALVTLADARHFNEILRALGHAFSENFVRQGARVIEALLPAGHPIYHVSVLSFAFPVAAAGESPPRIVTEIRRAFIDPLLCDNIPIKTRAGIGLIAIDGTDTAPAEALRAVLAAAQDSRNTEAGWAFYNRKTDAAHLRAFRILTDLPSAIRSADQLELHYQPRIDLASGRCVGAEALLRWSHPELGPISPGEFIALAEQTAIIGPLTDWVLRAAVTQTARWRRQGLQLKNSLNASPVNLSERGFDAKLLAICEKAGLPTDQIELEFTEGALAIDGKRTLAQLASIRAAGASVAIDDFGSGYSNMSYLAELPADVLKIDRSFLRPAADGAASGRLLRHIVELAKDLGLRTVAEGIESAEIRDRIRDLGCDEGQGYFFAKPMPPAAFENWLGAAS